MSEHAPSRPLNYRQLQFVAAYVGVARGNATEAARHAGYRGSTASLNVTGCKLLKSDAVIAAIEESRAAIRQEGIAVKQIRIDRADERHRALQQVIDGRAAQYANSTIPGASTGLLEHTQRSIGTGANAVTIDEYKIDVALLREMRELERQVSQELGEWTANQNVNLSGADGGPLAITVIRDWMDLHALAQMPDEEEGAD
jgi:hypothetical protein